MEDTRVTLKRRRWRKAGLTLLALLLLVGGVLGGGAAWLQSGAGHAFVRAKVLELAADALAGRVEAGAVEVDASGHVVLRNLKLYTPEGELVAELERLEADVALLALRRSRVHLTQVTVDKPRLYLAHDERGLNLARAVAPKKPSGPAAAPGGPSPWQVEVDALQLLDGAASFTSEDDRYTLGQLAATGAAKVRLEPLELTGALSVQARVTAPLDERLALELSASAARGPQDVDVTLTLGGSRLRASATLPTFDVTLSELVAAPREVAAFVPAWPLLVPVHAKGVASVRRAALDVRAGKASATVAATYDLPASKAPTLSLAVKDVDLAELVGASQPSAITANLSGSLDDFRSETLAGALVGDATWVARGQRLGSVAVDLKAQGGTLRFSKLELETPGARLFTVGTAALSNLALSGTLEAKDLARVDQTLRTFAGMDTAGLKGRGTLALNVTGPPTRPAAKAVGTLYGFAVVGVSAESIVVDADVPDVTRPLNTDTTLHARRLTVGESTFEEVTLDFYSFGRKLDLDLSTKGLGDLKLHVIGTLDKDNAGAALESADVTAAGARWVMEGTSRITWGERFVLAPLTLTEGERRITARAQVFRGQVDAEVTLLELDLARLPRAFVPESLGLAGFLSGRATLTGRTSNPQVEARATLRDGHLAGVSDLALELDARWKEQRATGTLSLSSSLGAVEGPFDVPVKALLEGKPAAASARLAVRDVELSAVERLLGRHLPVEGRLSANVELSGSADAPRLLAVVEAETLELDLDAPTGPLPERDAARQRPGRRRGPRGPAEPAVSAPSLPSRIVRLQRPRLTVKTDDAHTLGLEASASAVGGVAVVTLATPLTFASLRKQVPTAADALLLPVKLGLDVKGVSLEALRELRVHDDDELRGTLSLEGALEGAVRSPRGALTLTLTRAAYPPLKDVEVRTTVELGAKGVTLDGTLAVRAKEALALRASLAASPDALVAAALDGGDALVVAGAAPLSADVTLRQVSLSQLFPAKEGEQAPGGDVGATLELRGTPEAPEARLYGGLANLRFASVPLGSARFDVRSTAREQRLNVALGGQGRDDLKVKGTTGLDLRLSSLRKGLDWRAATVDLGLDAANFDLGFLSGASDRLRAVAGRLSLNGEVTGKLGDPRFLGDAALSRGRLALAGNGEFRDVEFELRVTNDLVDLSRLFLKSGAGQAELRARAERQASGSFRLAASAKTERLPLVNDDQLLANASLTLDLTGEATSKRVNITRLSLPRVDLGLPEVKRKDLQDLQRPRDIIVLRDGRRPTQRQRVEAKEAADKPKEAPFVVSALLDAPRNIWVRSSDVNVELGLSEGFRVEYADTLRLFGEASILRGTIEVIGREFSINKGSQARFAGVASQPYVNVSALHVNEREQVKITVTVTGRGSDVKISPTSEPAMPESDIYTVLATGRRQLQRGTGAALSAGQALSVVGQFVTSKAKTVLAKALPIDVLNFETSDDLQRLKVDVGKYLSDSLYLGGSANIGADRTRGENVFSGRLEYQVTKSVSVEAYAGDALSFGVDAVWSRDF